MTIVNMQEYITLRRYAAGEITWREAARDLQLWNLDDVEARLAMYTMDVHPQRNAHEQEAMLKVMGL